VGAVLASSHTVATTAPASALQHREPSQLEATPSRRRAPIVRVEAPRVPRTERRRENRAVQALSVRQPYAKLIMRGEKKVEYRSKPTKIR
jgi:hypothetical protein